MNIGDEVIIIKCEELGYYSSQKYIGESFIIEEIRSCRLAEYSGQNMYSGMMNGLQVVCLGKELKLNYNTKDLLDDLEKLEKNYEEKRY